MRVLVCGGRDFNNNNLFLETMFHHLPEDEEIEIISGMARGADQFAVLFAEAYEFKLHEFPADWETYGKAAGPIRNQQMLDEGHPDLVIAFPTKNSRGTWDMVRRAEKAGVKVIVVKEDEVQEE